MSNISKAAQKKIDALWSASLHPERVGYVTGLQGHKLDSFMNYLRDRLSKETPKELVSIEKSISGDALRFRSFIETYKSAFNRQSPAGR